jgi:hypothetical protein
LHDLENYFFLLVTLRELIAVALHARQVWCYFTLNLRTVKLQRRSWNRLRTSSGLSSGVLAAQPVWFEGRRGCKTGSTGQRSQRMLWSTTLQIGCDSGIFEKHWEATNTSIQFQPTAAQGIYQIGFLASGSWPSPCVDIVDSLWRVQEKDPLASENARHKVQHEIIVDKVPQAPRSLYGENTETKRSALHEKHGNELLRPAATLALGQPHPELGTELHMIDVAVLRQRTLHRWGQCSIQIIQIIKWSIQSMYTYIYILRR